MLNAIDRKGDNFREITADNTSNVEVVNHKGGNIHVLLNGPTIKSHVLAKVNTLKVRKYLQKLCYVDNSKIVSLKSIAMTQSCCVVNNPSTGHCSPKDLRKVLRYRFPRSNTNKLNAKRNIFYISLAQVVLKSSYLTIIKLPSFIHGDVH